MRKIIGKFYRLLLNIGLVSNIVKWLIVQKYKNLNQKSTKNKVLETPWVCMIEYDIDSCVNYINQVYNDYFDNSGLKTENIVGKLILEIGPGENFGVALRFLASGASQVVCVDKFNSLIDNAKQTAIYKRLLSTLNDEENKRLKNILTITQDSYSINTDSLKYINTSVEKLTSFYSPSHFVLIISRAVLEHIFMIDSAMETMDTLLKNSGFMLHEVDFRDHGMFINLCLHPMTMLTINDKTWDKMTSNLGAPNRKMMGYYKSYFHNHNYKYDTTIVRLAGSEKIVKLKKISEKDRNESISSWVNNELTKKYWSTVDSESLVAAAFFLAQKPN
jgi:hypothetical protein